MPQTRVPGGELLPLAEQVRGGVNLSNPKRARKRLTVTTLEDEVTKKAPKLMSGDRRARAQACVPDGDRGQSERCGMEFVWMIVLWSCRGSGQRRSEPEWARHAGTLHG